MRMCVFEKREEEEEEDGVNKERGLQFSRGERGETSRCLSLSLSLCRPGFSSRVRSIQKSGVVRFSLGVEVTEQ